MNIQLEKRRVKVENQPVASTLSLKRSILMITLLSLAGVLLQSFIQNGFFSYMHFVYIFYPVIVVLNALPVFLTISLFYFAFGKIWIGVLIAYLPLVILNIANYFKTVFRDEPLKLSDLALIGEMKSITQNYELKISLGIIAGVALGILLICYAAKHFKSEKLKASVKIVGIVSTLCLMLVSYKFVYTNRQLYQKIPTFAIEYHDTDMAKHHGHLYSLLVSAQSSTYKMPDGYSDEKVQKILTETVSAPATDKGKINVIAIMGEAFFDVTRGKTAQFVEGTAPYKNYHRLKSEGYHGKMIVPGFGGSTETTEFEFLTGASQYALDESMPTAYKTYATQPAYSLVQYFKDEGYETIALHPGYEWFYNRRNAYSYIGFDDFISRENMDEDAPQIYGYIRDDYTTDRIIENYLKHFEKSPDTPYFNFNVTIQNHGPYPDFDHNRDIVYERPDEMSDEHFWIINNYLTGVRDTDRLLGDICSFAEDRSEPIAVLFFGDHLPYLGEKTECFDALGYNVSHEETEGIENKYRVEYLMWSNAAAQEIIGNVKRGEGPEISSGFLGAELLSYLGVEKPAYFEFLSSVQEKINVISPNYYKSGDSIFYNLEGENKRIIDDYRMLMYYNFRRYNND